MTVSPLPRHGIALVGRGQAGRSLRVSTHGRSGQAVLSIWQDDVCRATVRLAPDDVADLIAALASALADARGGVSTPDAG